MNLDKAEEFLKSKGVDTEKYVIHDIKGGYNAQIPIALWLAEFAEQQVKSNGVLDDVSNCDSCSQEITVFAEQGTKKYCRECA